MKKILSFFYIIIKYLIYTLPLSFIFFIIFYLSYNWYFKENVNSETKSLISLKVYPINSYAIAKLETINFEIKDLFKKNDEISVAYDFLLNSNQEDYLNLFKHNLLQLIPKLYPKISFQLYDERNNIPYYDRKNFKMIIYLNQDDNFNEKSLLIELLNNTRSSVDTFLEIKDTKERLIEKYLIITENINNQITSIKEKILRLEYNLITINDLLMNNASSEEFCNSLESDQLLNFILLYQESYIINENLLGKCTFYLKVIQEQTMQALLSLQSSYTSIQHLDKDLDLSDEKIFLSLIDRFHDNFKYVEYDVDSINFEEIINNKEFNIIEYVIIYLLLFILSNFLVLFFIKIRNEFL